MSDREDTLGRLNRAELEKILEKASETYHTLSDFEAHVKKLTDGEEKRYLSAALPYIQKTVPEKRCYSLDPVFIEDILNHVCPQLS